MAANSPSPTGSIRSIASSSRSGTLSRPAPPPKPSHLSSAFTGTCNSIALRHYIQTHTTGGSFTTHSPSTATISRTRLGHGYDSSTEDHFVDAFDSSSGDEFDTAPRPPSSSRPTVRGRTYTAPSVSRVYDPSSHDSEAGDGTTHLIRNEPIAVDGTGPSRVGNLRSMFEAAVPNSSTPVALSRQNTGVGFQHTGTRQKPRISNQVRMLQAQITGDRFNGLAGAFNVADARSSVVLQTPRKPRTHQRDATDQSQDESIYRTATQDLLGDALKMDAVVIPPNHNTETGTVRASTSGSSTSARPLTEEPTSVDSDATISASTSAKAGLTSSRIRTITATHHDRDDSSATIRPSHSNHDVSHPRDASIGSPDAVSGTARRRSTRLVSGGTKGRLSSIFTASPQSSDRGHRASGISPSPSSHSVASASASEAERQAERSREPSMLIADDDDVSFSRTSHHLRANDGSCFELDWGAAHASPTKAAGVRNGLLSVAATSDVGENGSKAEADAKKDADQPRPPSIAIKFEQSNGNPGQTEPVEQPPVSLETTQPSLAPTTTSELQTPRPISARMPQPGIGKPARALYDFEGESAFNELIIRAGQPFEILNEQLAGGWSLGVVWDDQGVPTRGLIPQGWYCLIQDFTSSPPGNQGVEQEAMSGLVVEDAGAASLKLPPAATGSPDRRSSRVKAEVGSSARTGSPDRVQSAAAESTPVDHDDSPSQSASDSSDEMPSSASQNTEDAATVDTQPPISVSAFLDIGNEAAQWKQVEAETPAATAEPATDEQPVFPSPATAIDGMPAVSDANPIDWSAVAASHSPSIDVASLPDEPVQAPVEHVAGDVAPVADTESTMTTAGSDWKGSIFGKKTFNRFASFVTSGAEDYVLSDADLEGDERSRIIARKVSGGSKPGIPALTEVAEEEDEGAAAKQNGASAIPAQPLENSHAHDSLETQTEASEVELSAADPNHHFVVAGPAGPKWKSKSAPFLVQVHHPEKRTKLNGMQEHTVYHVTSTYPLDDNPDAVSGSYGCIPYDPLGGPYPPGAQVTVLRRFTQFEWLHQVLAKHYSALLIPPLPEKQYSGRFASDFIETRRVDLEMWMSRLVRHPVLRYSEPIRFFVSCDNEVEWRTCAALLLRNGCTAQDSTGAPAKGGVFAHTWHPEFNFDAAEAAVEADRMEAFLKALEKTMNGVGGHSAGKHGVLAAYRGHREGNVATSSTYRDLSYTLLRTLTGAGAGPSDSSEANGAVSAFADADAHRILGPPMGNVGRRSETGATNEHGAWCWREDCQDCLNLTSALQNTAECLQNVADIYESHARETLLRQHERFKEVSRPHTMAQSLLETHRTTLSRYRQATEDTPFDEDDDDDAATAAGAKLAPEEADKLAARCETVLNVTLSEMDRLHDERVQDYHALGRSLLDGEIELYESILEQLKAARLHYDGEYYEREADFHVLASRYQPELSRPKRPTAPLLMPSAAQGAVGGLRSAAGGVGLLISQATGGGGVTRPASVYDSLGVASPRKGSLGTGKGSLADSTNLPHSGADAALRGVVAKHGAEAQPGTSSYFSAIWR
ncbi:related to Sorting nexin 9 [Sporisorium reilianum SRZ2]|uniref:Related to Sorting nexin 9 n=1 Tax=Sporisorium reilianum (strain SRZ2) TaxID=999809 RepID=E7A0B7_SPORE|nr:related to Sorting nexin 9 [Sporisorium reilianum SRZ2]